MFPLDDTIVAISSAGGNAPRALVRLSGPQAIEIAAQIFHASNTPLDQLDGFRAADGLIRLAEPAIELPARAYLFRSPRSFTRQDVVELHIPAAAAATCGELIRLGARQAEPGEFTARAFFSGRIDLSAAEAVADVIDAENDAQLRAAMGALGGRIERLCAESADETADILAAVEASIDLAAEDIQIETPAELADRLDELSQRLEQTAGQAASIPESPTSAKVVLAGRPNVGKSSLLNALSGSDRAIVSAMAGTTRDVLTAEMPLPNGEFVTLVDAAGFLHPTTPLDIAAHTAARQAVATADVIAFVLDASQPQDEDQQLLADVRQVNRLSPVILAANKADLLEADASEAAGHLGIGPDHDLPGVMVSARTGQGLDELLQLVVSHLEKVSSTGGEQLALHERHKDCLREASRAAGRAGEVLRTAEQVADTAELVAIDLREALAALGQISGQVVTEDVLGRIFSRFCVGK